MGQEFLPEELFVRDFRYIQRLCETYDETRPVGLIREPPGRKHAAHPFCEACGRCQARSGPTNRCRRRDSKDQISEATNCIATACGSHRSRVAEAAFAVASI